MGKTAGNNWADCKTNAEITKELHMALILEEIQDYTRSWVPRINRMPRNRLTRLIRNYSQKTKGTETIEETSGCVRTEWVNKWPDSMIAT